MKYPSQPDLTSKVPPFVHSQISPKEVMRKIKHMRGKSEDEKHWAEKQMEQSLKRHEILQQTLITVGPHKRRNISIGAKTKELKP